MKNTNSVKVVAFPSTVNFETAFTNKMVEVLNQELPKPIKRSLSLVNSITQGKVIGLIKEESKGIHFADVSEIEMSMFRDDDTIDTLFDRLMKADEEIDKAQQASQAEEKPVCYCPACTANRTIQARSDGATDEQVAAIVDEAANKFVDQLFGSDEAEAEVETTEAQKPVLTEAQQFASDMMSAFKASHPEMPSPLSAGMGVASMLQGIMEERKEKRLELKRKASGMRQVLENLQNAGTKQAAKVRVTLHNKLTEHNTCGCPECTKRFEAQKPVLDGMVEAQRIMDTQGINALATAVDVVEKEITALKMKINAPVQSATLNDGTTIHAASRLKKADKEDVPADKVTDSVKETSEENQDETKPSDSRLEDLPADMPKELKSLLGAFMSAGAEVRMIKL